MTGALYGAIGLFHYVFRGELPGNLDGLTSGRQAQGVSVRFWDFCFTPRSAWS